MAGTKRGAVSRRGMIGGLAGASTVGIATLMRAAPAGAQESGSYLVAETENQTAGPTTIVSTTSTFSGEDEPVAFGVFLTGDEVEGIEPDSTWPAALAGTSDRTIGVYASTQSGSSALLAESTQAPAIIGKSNESVGVAGWSAGLEPGVWAKSDGGPQLALDPHSGASGPPTDHHPQGSLWLNGHGDLYVQTKVSPQDGWKRLAHADEIPTDEGPHLVLGEVNVVAGDDEGNPPDPTVLRGEGFETFVVDNPSSSGPATAITANASNGVGLFAQTTDGTAAIVSLSLASTAVYAESEGTAPAVVAKSGGAQLFLQPPTTRVGPPEVVEQYDKGALALDAVGDLYVKTAAGDTGWVRLVRQDQLPTAGRTIPLATPRRVLNTDLGAGGTRTVVLGDATGVPADASGVIATITAWDAGYTGYLAAAPADASARARVLSFDPTSGAETGGFTCGLSARSGGPAFTVAASGRGSRTVRVRVEITAYISG